MLTLRSEATVAVEIFNVFFIFLLAICEPQINFFLMLDNMGSYFLVGGFFVCFRWENIYNFALSFWKET